MISHSLIHLGNQVAGVDEAGRGPLAGPVVVAAVILPDGALLPGLNDSKKVSPKRRAALANLIKECAIAWSVEIVPVHIIDSLNILGATLWGMEQAVMKLSVAPAAVHIDGNKSPILPYPTYTEIQGDGRIACIAAASILAKVTRDTLMEDLDQEYPMYGFFQHKGYPTAAHLKNLEEHGICPHHRLSFAPVKRLIGFSAQ